MKEIASEMNNFTKQQISEIERQGEYTLKLSSGDVVLATEDVEIITEDIEGWLVEKSENITIALDTKLDNELITEGIIREFINRIQNYRKTNNYNVNDKINVFIKTDSNILNAISKNFNSIKNEINCDKLIESKENGIKFYETEINEIPCKFYIEKIS